MIGFPQIPVVPTPFANKADSRDDVIPAFSADVSSISYSLGIPIAYTIPKEGGGSCFTRKSMNRLVYDSTVGLFKAQTGYCNTFNPNVCDNIGGYAKGAVLKWFKFVRLDGLPIPDAAAENLLGEWTSFPPDLTQCKVGEIRLDSSNNPCVVTKAYEASADNEGIADISAEIKFVTVHEVISTIEDNVNDFRANGPSDGNGWKLLDENEEGYFPALGKGDSGVSVLFRRSASRNITVGNVDIPKNGWLIVDCSRDLSNSSMASTLGQVVRIHSDGFHGTVSSQFATEPVMTIDRQFGGTSVASAIIPVTAGSKASFSVTNSLGVNVEISARLVGTA